MSGNTQHPQHSQQRRTRVVMAALAGVVLAGLVPLAPAQAAAPTIALSRGSVIGGESITVGGSIGQARVRPVVLQRQSGTSWVNVVRSQTTTRGAYKFLFRPPTRTGTRTVVRAIAPRVRIGGRTFAQVTSGGRSVLTIGQSAAMTLPGLVSQGASFTVAGKFAPARPGRPVALQKPANGTWVGVATGYENSAGTVSIVTNLKAHGTYQFRLTALPANGAPAASSVSRTVRALMPVPTGVAATPGDASAQVSWNPVTATGLAGYNVYQRTDPGDSAAAWQKITPSPVSGTSLNVGSLTNGVTYYFTVTSIDAQGEESAFATKAAAKPVAPVDSTPPPVPTGVAAAVGDASSQVTWTAVSASDLAGYRVYRATSAAGPWTQLTASPISATSYPAAGLTNGSTYYFAVTSADSTGNESARSTPASVTPVGPPDTTAPPVPKGVGATGGNGTAHVSWDAVSADDLAGYAVYQGDSAAGPWTKLTSAPQSATTLDVTGLTNGHTYYFAVTSVDSAPTPNESAKAVSAGVVPSGAAKTWSAVSAGSQHTCAVRSDSTLWCWGRNGEGQLGSPAAIVQTAPAQVGNASTWASVSAGGDFTCAIQVDGTLWCWGTNTKGQLGSSGTVGSQSDVPVKVGTDTSWSSVSAGANAACAVKSTGSLWCWGLNSDGQLGSPSTGLDPNPTPAQVGAVTSWEGVSVGTDSTCATRTDHTLWCWGANLSGQLGVALNQGTGTPTPTPQQVTVAGAAWSQVSVGEYHACAVTTTAALYCWGENGYGELGKAANATSNPTPNQVAGTTWKQVSAGTDHTCAVTTAGTAFCWGRNQYGQLAKTASSAANATPNQVAGTGWDAIDAGSNHTAAHTSAGAVSTWGWNSSGQLGTAAAAGTENPTATPVAVAVP